MMEFEGLSDATMDRLDAAHALLGVSPNTVFYPMMTSSSDSLTKQSENDDKSLIQSAGLEALAALASSMEESSVPYIASSNSSSCGSDEDDAEIMPPPPPRGRRLRSCSNPEGMEKWDSLNNSSNRCRYVLPTCILEEKLAEAKVAVDKKKNDEVQMLVGAQRSRSNSVSSWGNIDDSSVDPDILLRRARSRLLEDLSEGSITGEKGQLTLPHALSKYKHVSHDSSILSVSI